MRQNVNNLTLIQTILKINENRKKSKNLYVSIEFLFVVLLLLTTHFCNKTLKNCKCKQKHATGAVL